MGGRGGCGDHRDLNSGQAMKIREYLQRKYKVEVPTTITKVEAQVFGIPYPLREKWLQKYGWREIQTWQLLDIKRLLGKRLEKQEQRNKKRGAKHTKEGIEAANVVIRKKQAAAPETDAFLESYEWRRVRMEALKKYGARCQCCGATPADGVKMHVDHIKPRKLYPELALNLNNLQILCEVCNHGKGNWDMTDWRGNGGSSTATGTSDVR